MQAHSTLFLLRRLVLPLRKEKANDSNLQSNRYERAAVSGRSNEIRYLGLRLTTFVLVRCRHIIGETLAEAAQIGWQESSGILISAISRFESWRPSQAVRSLRGVLAAQNFARHSRELAWPRAVCRATIKVRGEFAVGTTVTGRPPHRSERARFRHSAPTSGG